jgi:hypothetical protein
VSACPHIVELALERRPANALNLETAQALPRCKLKPPAHWGDSAPSVARWLLSGGSPLVLGCCSVKCPR